jgi:hypothetical protein
VPSGCGFEVGAISLPSGAMMRLRPPRRWNRMGLRTASVVPSSLLSALWIMPPFALLSHLDTSIYRVFRGG